jgi:hypothetical protein
MIKLNLNMEYSKITFETDNKKVVYKNASSKHPEKVVKLNDLDFENATKSRFIKYAIRENGFLRVVTLKKSLT